jgi:hypothetical protein
MTAEIIICTSLYGSNPKYRSGAMQSAADAETMRERYPGLKLVIYYDSSVPMSTLSALQGFPNLELVLVNSPWAGVGTLPSIYRFFGFRDYQTADLVATYDLDNKINCKFFVEMLQNALEGDSVFYFLKKSNAPKGRPLNADCWLGIPARSAIFPEICNSMSNQLLDFMGTMDDFEYGCDERILKFVVEGLVKYNCPESRIYRFYRNRIFNDSMHYDETQRQPVDASHVLKLESKLAASSAQFVPRRELALP